MVLFIGSGLDDGVLISCTGNGLEIVLYVEPDEYLETAHAAADLGVKFLPHNHTEPPFLKELGFGAAPGFRYFITLRQKEVTSISIH